MHHGGTETTENLRDLRASVVKLFLRCRPRDDRGLRRTPDPRWANSWMVGPLPSQGQASPPTMTIY